MNIDEVRFSTMCEISMALKSPKLQQGFEIICKNLSELKKENAELKEKLAGAERTRDNLVQLGFPTFQSCKEYVGLIKKMKCCGNCGKWENCEKDEMFSQDICGDWELWR